MAYLRMANSPTSTHRRIFISTGEVSGDLQGALLIEALYRQASAANLTLEITALGGHKMAQAGATLLADTTGIGSVGILETLPYILPTLKLQKLTQHHLKNHPPDVTILIDYMGPNLGVGTFVKQYLPTIPVIYYIAPQEWVWSFGDGDTSRIVKMTDLLLAIFPEEARYFKNKGASVQWVGHPLIDRMQTAPSRDAARAILGIAPDELAIALLPASRQQEIKHLMPVMFAAARQLQEKLPRVRFWIPLSLEKYRHPIQEAIAAFGLQATVISDQTLAILAASDLAITKSGTVNLEIALLKVPQVVVYRVSPATAWIARHILKFSIPFMAPPNLVNMKPIVPELLQQDANPEKIVAESLELLFNSERRQQIFANYEIMKQALGESGVCDRAAKIILEFQK